MIKTFKQKRKERRNEKHAIKNHEHMAYTNDTIQETLRQIRLVNNVIIKQSEERRRDERKLIEDQKISVNKEQSKSPTLTLKLQSYIFEQTPAPLPPKEFQMKLETPIYRAKDGHIHDYHESSETEIVCIRCGDIQLKKIIQGYALTPSLHKSRSKIRDNKNTQRYLAPLLPITWTGDKTGKAIMYSRLKTTHPEDKELQTLSLDEFENHRMKSVILDECIASDALIEKLKNEGFDGEFLGRSLPDRQIGEFAIEKNGILVTEDGEFYESMRTGGLLPCFVRKDDSIDNQILLIKKHMDEIFLRL